MISFPVTRSGKHYILSLHDSDDGRGMELVQTSNPAGAFDAQEILQAAFDKATAAALGHNEAEKPKAGNKRDPSAPPKLTKKRVAELREEYEDAVATGADPQQVLAAVANRHGYDMEKLDKALKRSWE